MSLRQKAAIAFAVGVLASGLGVALATTGDSPPPPSEEASSIVVPSTGEVPPGAEVAKEEIQIGSGGEPIPDFEIDYCRDKLEAAKPETDEAVYCEAILAKASGAEIPGGRYTTEELARLVHEEAGAGEDERLRRAAG